VTPVLVDTNVLIDVITQDATWGAWSEAAINEAQETAVVVINPVIYGELAVGFDSIEGLDAALPEALYRREGIPYASAFLAGKAYAAYRESGGSRTAPLPEFFIGAHAAVAGYRLLTRDPGRYRTTFPRLQLIAPA
jgi:predicted nucleic acid-binding protein